MFLTTRFPLVLHDGSLFGIGVVGLDISERKQLEQQLAHAQKMAGIGRLAGGIAHDFNNLLAIILGYAEMVAMELVDDHPLLKSIHNIETAANRAASLTQQLLAFARRQASELQRIDLNDFLQGMSEMLRPLVPEHTTLEIVFAAHVRAVMADVSQLEQVVFNLVVNARDAMPAGGTLTLRTDNVILDTPVYQGVNILPGAYVRLCVTDTGIGMSEEVQQHLFEPFFTTKERGKGTGLGLATSYGIIKQHRGYIFIASRPGRGTVVEVYLPSVPPAPDERSDRAKQTIVLRGTETVLVVEDEEMLRQLAVRALTMHGYTVLEAADGLKALQIATEHPERIDLLLSDVIMPEMGGRELAQWLRELRPETRVLFMSGYTDEVLDVGGDAVGDAPLIHKPYTTTDLLARIRQVLASS